MTSGTLMAGEFSLEFERLFMELTDRKFGVSVSTATTGLQIALRHAGVAGGEVLVPAASFITDVSAIQMEGATPILVDIDPETLSFDMDDLERKVTARTKAMIWIHLIGLIAENHADISSFAKQHDLFVIEDASHAHGATIDGRPAGSFGDVGVFSFYPTKLMTTGTGGMLVTDDECLSDYARSLRMFGKELQTGEIVNMGNDWFMDEFRACLVVHQARALKAGVERRREAAARYLANLRNKNFVNCLSIGRSSFPSWYQFPVFLHEDIDAQSVREAMNRQNVSCKQIYKPVHHEALFRDLDRPGLENTERVLGQSLCLPMFVDITDSEIDHVTDTLIETVSRIAAQ